LFHPSSQAPRMTFQNRSRSGYSEKSLLGRHETMQQAIHIAQRHGLVIPAEAEKYLTEFASKKPRINRDKYFSKFEAITSALKDGDIEQLRTAASQSRGVFKSSGQDAMKHLSKGNDQQPGAESLEKNQVLQAMDAAIANVNKGTAMGDLPVPFVVGDKTFKNKHECLNALKNAYDKTLDDKKLKDFLQIMATPRGPIKTQFGLTRSADAFFAALANNSVAQRKIGSILGCTERAPLPLPEVKTPAETRKDFRAEQQDVFGKQYWSSFFKASVDQTKNLAAFAEKLNDTFNPQHKPQGGLQGPKRP